MLADKIYGHSVLCPPGYDDVSVLLGGQAELIKGWLHEGGVLAQHVVQLTAALLYVSQDSSSIIKQAQLCLRLASN